MTSDLRCLSGNISSLVIFVWKSSVCVQNSAQYRGVVSGAAGTALAAPIICQSTN